MPAFCIKSVPALNVMLLPPVLVTSLLTVIWSRSVPLSVAVSSMEPPEVTESVTVRGELAAIFTLPAPEFSTAKPTPARSANSSAPVFITFISPEVLFKAFS